MPFRLVPAAKGSLAVPGDPVRALQHAVHRAAKADPGRRFHALYDKSAAVTFCGARELWCAITMAPSSPAVSSLLCGDMRPFSREAIRYSLVANSSA